MAMNVKTIDVVYFKSHFVSRTSFNYLRRHLACCHKFLMMTLEEEAKLFLCSSSSQLLASGGSEKNCGVCIQEKISSRTIKFSELLYMSCAKKREHSIMRKMAWKYEKSLQFVLSTSKMKYCNIAFKSEREREKVSNK